MRRTIFPLALLGTIFSCVLPALQAHAQAAQTFVSATGSDGNPCTFSSPCRSFQAAYGRTAPNGEINALKPAGYGQLTITKPISIQGHGFAAVEFGGSTHVGITINAGPSDRISLSGLILDGAGAGAAGILFTAGGALTVTHCVVRGVTGNGIEFTPTRTSQLAVSDTLVADNGNNGIVISPGNDQQQSYGVALSRVQAYNNTNDGVLVVDVNARVNVTVADSFVHNNQANGIHAISSNATPVVLVVGSVISNNGSPASNTGAGLLAEGTTAKIGLGQSALTGNAIAWQASGGGIVESFGDNYFRLNIRNDFGPPLTGMK